MLLMYERSAPAGSDFLEGRFAVIGGAHSSCTRSMSEMNSFSVAARLHGTLSIAIPPLFCVAKEQEATLFRRERCEPPALTPLPSSAMESSGSSR